MRIIFIMKINIKLEKNVIKLLYMLINNLFYFDNTKRGIRLYILKALK